MSFYVDKETWLAYVEEMSWGMDTQSKARQPKVEQPPVELCKWNGVKIREFNADEYKIGINDVLAAENKRLKRTLREWPLCGVDEIPVLVFCYANGRSCFYWRCPCRDRKEV